jgi:hypothetical protein
MEVDSSFSVETVLSYEIELNSDFDEGDTSSEFSSSTDDIEMTDFFNSQNEIKRQMNALIFKAYTELSSVKIDFENVLILNTNVESAFKVAFKKYRSAVLNMEDVELCDEKGNVMLLNNTGLISLLLMEINELGEQIRSIIKTQKMEEAQRFSSDSLKGGRNFGMNTYKPKRSDGN